MRKFSSGIKLSEYCEIFTSESSLRQMNAHLTSRYYIVENYRSNGKSQRMTRFPSNWENCLADSGFSRLKIMSHVALIVTEISFRGNLESMIMITLPSFPQVEGAVLTIRHYSSTEVDDHFLSTKQFKVRVKPYQKLGNVRTSQKDLWIKCGPDGTGVPFFKQADLVGP